MVHFFHPLLYLPWEYHELKQNFHFSIQFVDEIADWHKEHHRNVVSTWHNNLHTPGKTTNDPQCSFDGKRQPFHKSHNPDKTHNPPIRVKNHPKKVEFSMSNKIHIQKDFPQGTADKEQDPLEKQSPPS